MNFPNFPKIGPPEELLAAIRTEVDRRIRAIRDEFGIELGRLAAECWELRPLVEIEISLKPAITRELSGLDRLDLAVEQRRPRPNLGEIFFRRPPVQSAPEPEDR